MNDDFLDDILNIDNQIYTKNLSTYHEISVHELQEKGQDIGNKMATEMVNSYYFIQQFTLTILNDIESLQNDNSIRLKCRKILHLLKKLNLTDFISLNNDEIMEQNPNMKWSMIKHHFYKLLCVLKVDKQFDCTKLMLKNRPTVSKVTEW